MSKLHYLYKIYPQHPDFFEDERSAEKLILEKHIAYWQQMTNAKSEVLTGSDYDPLGTCPMAIIEVVTKEEADEIAMHDPAVASGAFSYTLFPMQPAQSGNIFPNRTLRIER